MTVAAAESRDRLAPAVAWSTAGLSAAGSVVAICLHPGGDVPWDAVTFPVLLGVPGALIARELPRNPLGWLLLLIAACFAGNAVALQWLAAGHDTAASAVAWWAERGSALLVPATLLLLLLLPDGKLPSPAWRPVVRAAVGIQSVVIFLGWLTPGLLATGDDVTPGAEGLTNPVGILPTSWTPTIESLVDPVLTIPLLLGIGAVIQRLRRPIGDERPRMISVLVGVVLFVLLVTLPDAAVPEARTAFHVVGTTLLSGTLLTAVVRGRFERVQVALSYALVYGGLSVVVLGAYIALVAVSTQAGATDSVAGLLTAGVALALLPARAQVQNLLRKAMYGDRGQPHRALRRLSSSVASSDDLAGVLDGIASSVRASLRARWVQVEFRGTVASSGQVTDATDEAVVLDGGEGDAGLLRVGFAAGRSLTADEQELLHDLAEHGARAARVVCLAADLATARHALVESREQERSRLRQDLHDDLGPILAGLVMQLGSMPELMRADADLATSRLGHLESQALAALGRTRNISRDLRPPTLDELGLVGAIVEAGRALGLRVNVGGDVPKGLTPAVEVAAYRIGAESLVNAQRHARADEVDLTLRQVAGMLTLVVADRGPGLGACEPGVGLRSMRERAAELGGSIELLTTPGGGLTVLVTLPEADTKGSMP